MKWRTELKENITTLEQLKQYVDIEPKEEKQLQKIIERHPMSITRYYMSLIDRNDPDDPIRKMIIPSLDELDVTGSYDPCGELENTKMPGLQHKYAQTAFILSTNRCAAYCRYCFRKRLVGLPSEEILHRFSDAVRYIEKHEEINNVLISGGDPFVLSTAVIEKFLANLSGIHHLDFIRFGSRSIVTFPDRVLEDEDLINLLSRYSRKYKRVYVTTQFNHPREITGPSIEAADRFIRSGIILNNQTVLLSGVNDDPFILAELQSKLVAIGVAPYYVFQCRPVKRVKRQFQVPLGKGYKVVEEAKRRLDGLSKRFRYVMSHRTGKIVVEGVEGDEIYFKYLQAKNPYNIGKFFKRKLTETAGWLDDLE
jgi:KamA family protein